MDYILIICIFENLINCYKAWIPLEKYIIFKSKYNFTVSTDDLKSIWEIV